MYEGKDLVDVVIPKNLYDEGCMRCGRLKNDGSCDGKCVSDFISSL